MGGLRVFELTDLHTSERWQRAVDITRHIFGFETRTDAWIAGAQSADAEWEESYADKEDYIERQGQMITQLDQWIWSKGIGPDLPPDLEMWLRDHR